MLVGKDQFMWNKLKGFTILEVLLAAAITAILTTLALWGYELLQKQYLLFQNTQDQIWETEQLITQLQYHSLDCQSIFLLDNTIQFKWDSLQRTYRFEAEQIVEQTQLFSTSILDTFFITAGIPFASLNQEQKTEGLIDQFEIQMIVFGKERLIHFEKTYSARELMKQDDL